MITSITNWWKLIWKCEFKPDVQFAKKMLVLGIECLSVSKALLNFRFLKFEPHVILLLEVNLSVFQIAASISFSFTSILSLCWVRVVSITPMHATKSIHIMLVCRITTAKAPSCMQQNEINLTLEWIYVSLYEYAYVFMFNKLHG